MIACLAIWGCDQPSTNLAELERQVDEAQAELAAMEAGVGEQNNTWRYQSRRDEARNANVEEAMLTSNNGVWLAPPYNGGTRATLHIRQHPEWGLNIFVVAQPAQILCSSYEPCTGLINIDGEPERLTLIGSQDGNSEVVFFRYPEPMLGKIAASEKVIIELPFYANGNRQFTFATHGLTWPISD